MGTSTDAMLLYGYHLGNEDNWLLEDAGQFGQLPTLDWYDPNTERFDFIEAAERRLLTELAGFTETGTSGDGYLSRMRDAEDRIGVEFQSHCSNVYPMWVLAAGRITAYQGDVFGIDPGRLAAAPGENGWDARLDAAVQALGIRPKQPRPMWLLCSYWG